MEENTQIKKKSNKIIIVAVLAAVILVAAVAGVYYCTLPSQPKTPETPDVVTNFSDGAWANYDMNYYATNGTLVSKDSMMVYAYASTENGTDYWVYVENETCTNSDGTIVNEVSTYYLDKSTYSNVHLHSEVFTDGVQTYDKEYVPGDTGFPDDLTHFQGMTVIASDESVTVPAGTFNTQETHGTYNFLITGTTYDMTAWSNADVPAWGIVKYEFTAADGSSYEYVLESYGS